MSIFGSVLSISQHCQNFQVTTPRQCNSMRIPLTMPKRKRSSTSPSQLQPQDPIARQKKLCTQRLTTALKPLIAALRLAAGFERQKHSRRKKTAQSKNDAAALARLETEYAVLKTLDLEKVANQHLRKTVGRVKSLKEAEALQEYINGGAGSGEKGYEGRSLAKDPATLNVTARLYKVPAVKKVVDEVIADLKGIVGGAEGAGKEQNGKKASERREDRSHAVEDQDEEMLDVSDDAEDPYTAFSARIAAPSSGEDDSETSISGDERPPSICDSDSEHDPDADLEAASSDEDDESTSFHGFSSDEAEATNPSPSPDYNEHFLSISATVSSDSDTDSDSDTAIAKPKRKQAAKLAQPTSSAFLPALSHANYVSGSESEASDLDDENVAPKKNRRGQRARQKIAEAKFGAKAKHLDKVQRNQGWDAKRGAVGGDSRQRGGREGRSVRGGRGPQQSGGNAEPLGDKKGPGATRDDKGTLHPSWQAAKAAKESKKLKIEIGSKAAVGKKVVFD